MTCKTFPICCCRRTRRQAVDQGPPSTRFEILRRLLAAVADQLVLDHLTFVERAQAGALDRGDMDEYVFAAVLRLNESIALGRVEPFHGASSHLGLLVCTNLIATPRPSCDRPSEVSVAYGKAHREVRDKTRPSSNIGTVRGSLAGFNGIFMGAPAMRRTRAPMRGCARLGKSPT